MWILENTKAEGTFSKAKLYSNWRPPLKIFIIIIIIIIIITIIIIIKVQRFHYLHF